MKNSNLIGLLENAFTGSSPTSMSDLAVDFFYRLQLIDMRGDMRTLIPILLFQWKCSFLMFFLSPCWLLHELISNCLTGIGCDCVAADTKVLEKETLYMVLGSSNNPTFTCLQILTLFTTLQDYFRLLICAHFFRKPRVISIYQGIHPVSRTLPPWAFFS